ncbi:hypothetical protein HO173_008639 [Letharia columbiana]|uniref:Uncharacterized protein n=1 Tax=Letharia columbiana TaxID=112416 RepID=A0A8H6L2G8_9LECA|nr:uncharacterized protein HO173_008639 [Letharia columbiana]KAF6233095.1 hypothetical protein HO173_008639 [Letharia columbiana]
MSLQDDIDGFWLRVRRAREAVGRAENELLFLKEPSLGDRFRRLIDELKRLLFEEAYTEESRTQATLAVEAALSAAADHKATSGEVPDNPGNRYLESQNEPAVERTNEFRMSEKLST